MMLGLIFKSGGGGGDFIGIWPWAFIRINTVSESSTQSKFYVFIAHSKGVLRFDHHHGTIFSCICITRIEVATKFHNVFKSFLTNNLGFYTKFLIF